MNNTAPFPRSRILPRPTESFPSHRPKRTSLCLPLLALAAWLLPATAELWTLTLTAQDRPRPNILWLTAEDMSPHLGSYGDPYATTPHLDAFAKTAVRYTHAFATAPVCSPARSTLITGMYATSLGTQRLRSQFPVPPNIRAFSALLREAGYYCSNRVKTDYNLADEPRFINDAWDVSSNTAHWRTRNPSQPFFAVFNFMTTHQSRTSVWTHDEFEREVGAHLTPEQRHDPAQANLPPYYPDTHEARRAWARYHDCITRMDQEVADLLHQLHTDGLAEDTIIFFYSDHGMGMPRGKRLLHDSGLHVPLLIHFPQKWQHLAPAPPGATTDRLVSFVDFAPTLLSLCTVPIPAHMQGVPFLGPAAGPPRDSVFAARDRVDEVFDLSRSVRNHRWLYIRNFMPHLSWMPPERYSDGSTFRQEWKHLAAAGQLDRNQLAYASPRRALEELYDTHNDPHQLANLATAPKHQNTLRQMRAELHQWQLESRDLGFLTEPQVWERLSLAPTPLAMGRNDSLYPLTRLLDAAGLVGKIEAMPRQLELLADPDDAIRYWAALGLHAAGPAVAPARGLLRPRLSDQSPVVRIETATALAHLGETELAFNVLAKTLASRQPEPALHAARAIELLGSQPDSLRPVMEDALNWARLGGHTNDILMFIQFSLEAALE
jgi:N-sulfoglucosamine sulfohydrolase